MAFEPLRVWQIPTLSNLLCPLLTLANRKQSRDDRNVCTRILCCSSSTSNDISLSSLQAGIAIFSLSNRASHPKTSRSTRLLASTPNDRCHVIKPSLGQKRRKMKKTQRPRPCRKIDGKLSQIVETVLRKTFFSFHFSVIVQIR